jgi:hypothetical protein
VGFAPDSKQFKDTQNMAVARALSRGMSVPLSFVGKNWFDSVSGDLLVALFTEALVYYTSGAAGEDLATSAQEAQEAIERMTNLAPNARIANAPHANTSGFGALQAHLPISFGSSPSSFSRSSVLAASNATISDTYRGDFHRLQNVTTAINSLESRAHAMELWIQGARSSICDIQSKIQSGTIGVPTLATSYASPYSKNQGFQEPSVPNCPSDHQGVGLAIDLIEDERRLRAQLGEGAEWLKLEDLYEFKKIVTTHHEFVESTRSDLYTIARFLFQAINYEDVEDELKPEESIQILERPPRVLPRIVQDIITESQVSTEVATMALRSHWVTIIVGLLLQGYTTVNDPNGGGAYKPMMVPAFIPPYIKDIQTFKATETQQGQAVVGRPRPTASRLRRGEFPKVPLPVLAYSPLIQLNEVMPDMGTYSELRTKLGYHGTDALVIPYSLLTTAILPDPFLEPLRAFMNEAKELTSGLMELAGPEAMHLRYYGKDAPTLTQCRNALASTGMSPSGYPVLQTINPAAALSLDSVSYPEYEIRKIADNQELENLEVSLKSEAPFSPAYCALVIRPRLPIRDEAMNALIQKRKEEALALLKEHGDTRVL